MEKLKVLDLFSGIGGFSLGLERTGGFETVAFCEIDEAARKVLRTHWPTVPIHEDVTQLKGSDVGSIQVICGGFPCQDISIAGRGEGISGKRSGLWSEYLRLIKETKPAWAIIENVPALRSRGLDEVLWGLTQIGYDAQWHCIPASALGAPHQRDRIWIVAHPSGMQCDGCTDESEGCSLQVPESGSCGGADDMADARCKGLQRSERLRDHLAEALRGWQATPRPTAERCPVSGRTLYSWNPEPGMGRVADGVPGRVDRLKQLGNAVVPAIPELLGRAILAMQDH